MCNTHEFQVGYIIIWKGNRNSIPYGWKICDGSDETPDLRKTVCITGHGENQVRECLDYATMFYIQKVDSSGVGKINYVVGYFVDKGKQNMVTKNLSKREIDIVSVMLAFPSFILLFMGLMVAIIYKIPQFPLTLVFMFGMLSGVWAYSCGELRNKKLKENGYIK